MPAPPPPPPPTFSAPSANADGRGMLLQSIRAGKSLKKTTTVDKSGPALTGKIKDESSSTGAPPFRGTPGGGATSSTPSNNGGPPSLGGLFSGGMPKLKATGLRSNILDKESNTSSSPSPPAASVSPAPSIKRGPPPVPPPATQKPQIFPELPIPEVVPSKGFGKPMLAPKPPGTPLGPPQKPSPPPKKLNLMSGPSVSRAQSMRLPRSPPVLAPASLSSLHQSQDCLNETQHNRPLNRVLRPPIARPPSPPTSKISHNVTRVAPPPPSRLAVTAPSMPPPPPPPPYRSTSIHQRLAPPPPPTPPTRIASASSSASAAIRNGQIAAATTMTTTNVSATTTTMMMMMSSDLDTRFADKFHSIMNFPNPSPFRGFPKLYNSKNANKLASKAPRA